MIRIWRVALLLSAVVPLFAADSARWFEAKTADIELKARLVRDQKEITSLLGENLDGDYILVELEIKPILGAKFDLDRDDFMMRSYRNNDTSLAQSPDRIAGGGELVLGQKRTSTAAVFSESGSGIPVGGTPGTGTRPRRIGDRRGALGPGTTAQRTTEISEGHGWSEDGLLGRLKAYELPVGETDDIARGYLYFQMNPNNKPKNLTLNYDGPAGELRIHFKQ